MKKKHKKFRVGSIVVHKDHPDWGPGEIVEIRPGSDNGKVRQIRIAVVRLLMLINKPRVEDWLGAVEMDKLRLASDQEAAMGLLANL